MSRRLRVLVADDDAQNRYLTRFVLERAGHEVAEVPDGTLVLAAVRLEHPDVVLLDMMMPGMDGHAVARAVKGEPSPPVVVALTALAMAGDREAALEAGCDGYLSKPLDPAALIDAVENTASHGGGDS